MTTRLVLLRHGETERAGECAGQRCDPGLSERGREQVAAAFGRLNLRPDKIVTSPARRARQTAALWDPQPLTDERLAERDFGAWEGRAWAELWPTVPETVSSDPAAYAAYTPAGAETLAQVAARAWQAALDVTAEAGRTVLAVTHAGPLRLVVATALGLPGPASFALAAERGRAAILVRSGDAWTLERLGA